MKRAISAIFISGALAVSACSADADVLQLDPAQAAAKVETGEIFIVDVRTPQEWRHSGVVEGAELVTLQDPDFIPKIMALMDEHAGKDVAFICRTSNRSMTAARIIHDQTGAPVYNVTEGMVGRTRSDGWIARGLPSESCCS